MELSFWVVTWVILGSLYAVLVVTWVVSMWRCRPWSPNLLLPPEGEPDSSRFGQKPSKQG